MSTSLTFSATAVPLPRFFVGRNHAGQWIARDAAGRRGGLFRNRCEAMHYASFESGHHPDGVTVVEDFIELNMTAATASR